MQVAVIILTVLYDVSTLKTCVRNFFFNFKISNFFVKIKNSMIFNEILSLNGHISKQFFDFINVILH